MKGKITNLAVYTLICVISFSVTHAFNLDSKVLAPTIPPQADPFYADLTV